MSWQSIWTIVRVLPQVYNLIKQIIKIVQAAKIEQQKAVRKENLENLQEAKTEQEVKDAAKKYFDSLP